jgi:hypothetical protein
MVIEFDTSVSGHQSKDFLNLSDRNPEIIEKPFFCFVIRDFFPQDLYQALYDEFPGPDAFTRKLGEGKRFMTPADIPRAITASPAWSWFTSNLSSQWFLDHVFQFLKPHLLKSRGLPGLRRWKSISDESGGNATSILERNVKVNYEFSRLPAGSYLSPHTDKIGKLASMLFYFPHPDWKDARQGSTEFYAPNDPSMRRNWSNRHLDFDNLKPFLSVDFKPNTLLGFVKTADSYHGVREIICPDGLERTSFNMNYSVPIADQRTLLGRGIASYHRRLEAWNFRNMPDLKAMDSQQRRSEIEALSRQGLSDDDIALKAGMTREQLEYFRNYGE